MRRLGIALVLVAVLAPRGPARAANSFSNASLVGSYGAGYSGSVLVGGQVFGHDGVQLYIFNGNGSFTGTETFTILTGAGQLTCTGTTEGTYNVKGDGTGTNTITFTPAAGQDPNCLPASATGSLVLSHLGSVFRFISTGNLAPGIAIHIHGEGQKQQAGTEDQ